MTETEIEKNLSELFSLPQVEGIITGTRNGFLKEALPAPNDIRHIQDSASLVAMASVILGAAETMLSLFEKDLPREIILRGEHTARVIIGAGPETFLLVLINTKPSDELLDKIRSVAGKIRKTESVLPAKL